MGADYSHLFEARVSRRTAGKIAVVAGLGSAVAVETLNATLKQSALAAQEGGWVVTPKTDYVRGGGEQSFNWLDLDVPIGGYFGAVEQADQIVNGDRAFSVVRQQPIGELVEWLRGVRRSQMPGQQGWLGDCLAAFVASGNCPRIEGPREAFGVEMPWVERMVGANLYHANTKEVMAWGRRPEIGPYAQNVEEMGDITPEAYQRIQEMFEEKRAEGLVWGVDTAKVRGREDEEWWVHINGFNNQYLVCTDFVNWRGMGQSPTRLPFRQFPYWEAMRIVLMDPSQPQPGLESNFYQIFDRPIMSVYLDMAEADLK